MAFRPVLFRPMSGRIIAVTTAAACLVGMVALFWIRGDVEYGARSAGAIAFLGALAIAVFWMPKIDVRHDEIEVRNVFSTARVPWEAIRSIETRWSLALVTDRGKVTAWASPPVRRGIGADIMIHGFNSVLPGSPASERRRLEHERDNVAEVIRARWAELADQGKLDPPDTGSGPRRTVHIVTIVVLGGFLLAAILGVVL